MGRGYDGSSHGQLFLPGDHTERERAQKAAVRRAATRLVGTRAVDAADCALLLDMLGLNPSEGLTR